MKRWILGAAVFIALAGLVLPNLSVTRAVRGAAPAQQPEAPASISLPTFLTGLSSPVGVYNAGDESNRLFIVERTGKIRVLQPGSTTPTDFLDVSAKVALNYVERGLLGLAFHPQYKTNGRFFIYYVKVGDGSIQLSEYHVSSNPNVADTTEIPFLNILHPTNLNHNGGQLAFGGDGYLYLGPGDGGSGNDPPNNAQNINELKGKILRIDVNTPNGGTPYSSPASNPFFGATAGADEIWMIGMRNPWRFSFDRADRNKLWIGDVGQDAVEEIDSIDITQNPASGARNGGWRIFEGTTCTGIDPCNQPANYIPPVATYANAGSRCSITGGFVYRGRRGTFPQGTYVYADYCTGEIFTLIGTTQTLVLDSDSNLTSFGEDEAGEIYACHSSGLVRRLTESTAAVPRNETADFDGDLKSDISVYRSGAWYVLNSFTNAFSGTTFGSATDRPVPGDYDGDGKTDIAVWRDSEGVFYILNSSNGVFRGVRFGSSGDLPVQADYDNDRKTDIAVYRPSAGVWYYLNSSNGAFVSQVFGAAGDQPVPGDYNGDGLSDYALFRPSAGQWFSLQNGGGSSSAAVFGSSGDQAIPADYDGDGKTDLAVFRPSSGGWYILRSSNTSLQAVTWGSAGDVPVPGDYDADNRDDIAVYRGGSWFILRSSDSAFKAVSFGLPGDVPVPSAYKPQ
jgi:glucose/arabinose dehydrogenase